MRRRYCLAGITKLGERVAIMKLGERVAITKLGEQVAGNTKLEW